MQNRSLGRTGLALGALAAAALTGAASAQGTSIGADVVYTDAQDVYSAGSVVVGGETIYGYALGSYTCNYGNVNLAWNNNGTPVLAMNAYRMYDGRLMQIGMSWCKYACCAASGTGCGFTCGASVGPTGLRPGCRDIYGGSYNAGQGRLGARGGVNPWTGALIAPAGGTGNAIYKRLQVNRTDMQQANFPNALYFVEGVYVGTDDAANNNRWNNASYERVTVNQSTFAMSSNVSPMQIGIPAIYAWRDHGNGINQPDNSVKISIADIPMEGRFYVAGKVKDNGDGTYRYDYAIFNLNSARAGGSFEIPISACANVSSIGFSAPLYHSGEVQQNTPWTSQRTATSVKWTVQPNANPAAANALRWGTMYNFWFTTDMAPSSSPGAGTLGVFAPSTGPASILANDLPVPPGPCQIDFDCSGGVDDLDILAFFAAFEDGDADLNGDDGVDDLDISYFFTLFEQGC